MKMLIVAGALALGLMSVTSRSAEAANVGAMTAMRPSGTQASEKVHYRRWHHRHWRRHHGPRVHYGFAYYPPVYAYPYYRPHYRSYGYRSGRHHRHYGRRW